ncbi:hypothetical protein XJ44_05440 [Thermosipho affectus]|uniref:Uncharacterized protein n=1 Tax=Thermosipho affectus TaxID=660294 RepID=A0ABX3IHA7_9BACT|nr:DUF5693 family protein [Thermosipho affectus]ONN27224.1 hypothetical protein XJ44_05440 [Thermosipho affectus]
MKIKILSYTSLNKVLFIFTIIALLSSLIRIIPDIENMKTKIVFEDLNEVFFSDGKTIPTKFSKYVVLKDATTVDIDIKDKVFGILEFNSSFKLSQNYAKKLTNVINVHYIKPEELTKYNEKTLFKRLWRAVVERSIDLIVLPRTKLTETVAKKFNNYFPTSEPSPYIVKAKNIKYVFLVILVLFVFSLFPFIAFFIPILYFSYDYFVSIVSIIGTIFVFKKVNNNILKFFSYFSLGIFTNLSLYDFYHVNNIETFKLVKLSLILLPVILLIELINTQNKEFKKYIKILLPIFTIFGIYYIIRSGNYGFVSDFERNLREFIEDIFIIRPRTKELIFYPLLFLAPYTKNIFFRKFFQIFGSIALLSTFNTFCHIRAPLFINVYRELFTLFISIIIFSIINLFFERSVLYEKNKNSIHNRSRH